MSVLNTMLRDLAQRQAAPLAQAPAGVEVVARSKNTAARRWLWVLLPLALAAAWYGGSLVRPKPAPSTVPANRGQTTVALRPASINPQPTPINSNASLIRPAPAANPPASPPSSTISSVPTPQSVQQELADLASAQALLMQGQQEQARALLEGMAQHNAASTMLLARLQVEQGDSKQAYQTLAQLPTKLRSAEYLAFQGTLAQRLQQYEAASSHYRSALKLNGKLLQAEVGLGLCLIKLGQAEQGKQLLRKAFPRSQGAVRNLIEQALYEDPL